MDHTRHINIFQVPIHYHVGIIGAGGIGAMTALVLSKMGVVRMTVWDDDVVSQENIATQLHPHSDVGNYKVESLQRTLETFSDEIYFTGIHERIDPKKTYISQWAFEKPRYDLFITAVDSITARQQIWQEMTFYNARTLWFLDMRMSAEQYQHFLVDMSDDGAVKRYEDLLFSVNEADVPDVPCTEKATFYTSSMSAGHAGRVLRNILRNEAKSERLVHYIPEAQIATFHV